jgi:hypothetical protein
LCLLAKSGVVRVKTVMVLPWATASTLIQPQRSMTWAMDASGDQTMVPAPEFQFPVGSMPTRSRGLAGPTEV